MTLVGSDRLAELERTLDQILSTIEHLRALLRMQRDAVATADLDRLLTAVEEQEVANARLAQLEARRQELQRMLEQALAVDGLPAVLRAAYPDELTHPAGIELAERLGAAVAHLQREQQQAAALLSVAAATAARTRAYLVRLAGMAPAYGPPGTAKETSIR
jgi:hypothetical protein